MQPEQQQRIMGYFIEEAKDHLNTIEQGLMNLQSTIEDQEMVNEVFRAAHSVKGGAAMLGLNSIQKTAHRLEDCFKLLKECPVKVDQKLESLFLRVSDTLKELLEQLQRPFGITDEAANSIMANVEPVFEELNTHLNALLDGTGANMAPIAVESVRALQSDHETPVQQPKKKPLPLTFQRDVLVHLKEMLQLFKQPDIPENREHLQELCGSLSHLDGTINEPAWASLLETSSEAIANCENPYRTLANVVIKEIKQAQDLMVAGKTEEIAASDRLISLLPISSTLGTELEESTSHSFQPHQHAQNNRADYEDTVTQVETFAENIENEQLIYASAKDTNFVAADALNNSFMEEAISSHQTYYQRQIDQDPPAKRVTADAHGPEVGIAEINSLADLFEGDTPELDESWQEEEIERSQLEGDSDSLDDTSMDSMGDFSDLLSESYDSSGSSSNLASKGDDLISLFGDDFLEEGMPEEREQAQGRSETLENNEWLLVETEQRNITDLADLLSDAPEMPVAEAGLETTEATQPEDLTSLFGEDNFLLEEAFTPQTADLADALDFSLDTPVNSPDMSDRDLFDFASDESDTQEAAIESLPLTLPSSLGESLHAELPGVETEDDLFSSPSASSFWDEDDQRSLLEEPSANAGDDLTLDFEIEEDTDERLKFIDFSADDLPDNQSQVSNLNLDEPLFQQDLRDSFDNGSMFDNEVAVSSEGYNEANLFDDTSLESINYKAGDINRELTPTNATGKEVFDSNLELSGLPASAEDLDFDLWQEEPEEQLIPLSGDTSLAAVENTNLDASSPVSTSVEAVNLEEVPDFEAFNWEETTDNFLNEGSLTEIQWDATDTDARGIQETVAQLEDESARLETISFDNPFAEVPVEQVDSRTPTQTDEQVFDFDATITNNSFIFDEESGGEDIDDLFGNPADIQAANLQESPFDTLIDGSSEASFGDWFGAESSTTEALELSTSDVPTPIMGEVETDFVELPDWFATDEETPPGFNALNELIDVQPDAIALPENMEAIENSDRTVIQPPVIPYQEGEVIGEEPDFLFSPLASVETGENLGLLENEQTAEGLTQLDVSDDNLFESKMGFDWDTEEATSLELPAEVGENLESLFAERTPQEIQNQELNADLFSPATNAEDWNFDESAEELETPESPFEMSAPAAGENLESLFGTEIPAETQNQALDVDLFLSAEELETPESLFEMPASAATDIENWNFESAQELETPESPFEMSAPSAGENLESLFGTEIPAETQNQGLDVDLFSSAEELETPESLFEMAASAATDIENWNFESAQELETPESPFEMSAPSAGENLESLFGAEILEESQTPLNESLLSSATDEDWNFDESTEELETSESLLEMPAPPAVGENLESLFGAEISEETQIQDSDTDWFSSTEKLETSESLLEMPAPPAVEENLESLFGAEISEETQIQDSDAYWFSSTEKLETSESLLEMPESAAVGENLESLFGAEISEETQIQDSDAYWFSSTQELKTSESLLEMPAPPAVGENLESLFGAEISEETQIQDSDTDWFSSTQELETSESLLEMPESAAGENLESLFGAEIPEETQIQGLDTDLRSLAVDVDDWNFEPSLELYPSEDLNIEDEFSFTDGFDELEITQTEEAMPTVSEFAVADEFDELDVLLGDELTPSVSGITGRDEFDELDALLDDELTPTAVEEVDLGEFDEIEALLNEELAIPPQISTTSNFKPVKSAAASAAAALVDDGFGDLEDLLKQADQTMGGQPTTSSNSGQASGNRRPSRVFEQTMRVPVKHLDNLSNLVGELVVNRNTLEQDQERLRQFLDNLLHQVQQLSDVGARMQDLYERSLLESSLLASRQTHRAPTAGRITDDRSQDNHSTGEYYDPLEMDRFTGFHLLSQEMIELIVRVRESASDIEFLVDETDQVARMLRQVTTQLQEGLTRSRMVAFAQTADRLPRAVREISLQCGKQAELHIEGRETLIDKVILEHLYNPMTHLVNNAISHGIESPEVRKAAGKPPVGRITIRSFHQGNQTVISLSDDGAGIDPERVKAKAIEKKLITPAEARTMSRVEVYDLLFSAGFSTADQVDDLKGRGVGMNVVLKDLTEIRGTVHTDSTIGKGTTFTIRLPLTLSICKALCCLSDRARIAFPMDGVEDMMDVSKDRIQTDANGQTSIVWRDSLLPFQHLSGLLKYNRYLGRGIVYGGKREDDMISIVVLRSSGNFIAVEVDQVLGEQEIVIKQLEGPMPKPVGVAGATVLGDGRIMPIADVLELIDISLGRIRAQNNTPLWESGASIPVEVVPVKTEPMVLIVDDSITVRELLSMTFNKAGYRVEQARDGQEAWDKLRSGLPCDIVFCDIEMPRMDGLELLSRIQKDETLSLLPVAMLTSRGADRHRQMASQLGASGYFTKPYLEEALLDAAQRMMKGEVLLTSNAQ